MMELAAAFLDCFADKPKGLSQMLSILKKNTENFIAKFQFEYKQKKQRTALNPVKIRNKKLLINITGIDCDTNA